MPRFLIVAPRPPWDADFAGLTDRDGTGVTRIASAAITTIAAFAPADVTPILCDEAITPVDLDMPADYVGLTSNSAQLPRAIELAREFRARGRRVIIGGPQVTLDPSVFDGLCDVIVAGEFEAVADRFYADMCAGTLASRYDGGRPDITQSPVPAWELYPNDRALFGVVQTSRGCPFECNFCDVIQYVGRVQRHKTDAQVIAEVQKLYDLGYNSVFLADDNFTVYRRRATKLLEALARWNGREDRGFVLFGTQVSLDIAADRGMLELCAEAGLTSLFIGVETINQDSLRAAGKRQNLIDDTRERIADVVRHGIDVTVALMLGFDQDGPDIFVRQHEFAAALPVSNFKISVLSAPTSTPLYAELAAAGRIVTSPADAAYASSELITNIVPAQMDGETLAIGARWLISRLFHPDSFVARVDAAAALATPSRVAARAHRHLPPGRALADRLFLRLMRDLARDDPAVARAIAHVSALIRSRSDIALHLQSMLYSWLLSLNGHRHRGSYDPVLSSLAEPPLPGAQRGWASAGGSSIAASATLPSTGL